MRPTRPYTAVYGDYLVKIAEEHGTTWQEIWNHPENAGHRAKRSSPDVLYPGDVLHIPFDGPPSSPPPSTPPPPSMPPQSVPPIPVIDPSWPYGELPEILRRKEPSWRCHTGHCECHPTDEALEVITHTVFLHDDASHRMPGARCRVYGSGARAPDFASADGSLAIEVTNATRTLVLEWAPADTPLVAPYPFRRRYSIALGDEAEEQVERRLNNIGFARLPTLEEKIEGFQRTYGLPADGRTESVLAALVPYHDAASLPPLLDVPDPERPGVTKRQPGPPLPPDPRPPSQGAVAAVEEIEPRTCHFSFVLLDERLDAPIAGASYVILDGLTVVHHGTTDAQGALEHGDVPGGDYGLHIRGIEMTIPAIDKEETRRPLLLLADRQR